MMWSLSSTDFVLLCGLMHRLCCCKPLIKLKACSFSLRHSSTYPYLSTMEPRIYQFYNNTADTLRPVSPTFSNLSPMVPNPLDSYREQQEEQDKSRSHFPVIQRSFAFDEWDEDNEDDEVSYNSSNRSGDNSRCQPETLAVITVEYGHTIYDATQGQFQPQASNRSQVLPLSLDTYMTVSHLNDTVTSKIHNKTTSFSTSTETSGNNNHHDYQQFHHSHSSPFEFVCQSIPRHSMTYRWTTENTEQPNEAPNNGGMEDTDDHSNSSGASETLCPIPEYITVYKNE